MKKIKFFEQFVNDKLSSDKPGPSEGPVTEHLPLSSEFNIYLNNLIEILIDDGCPQKLAIELVDDYMTVLENYFKRNITEQQAFEEIF